MIKPPKKKLHAGLSNMARPRATGEDASPAFPRRPAAPRMKFLATSDPAASAPRVAGDGGGFIADRARPRV